MPTYGLTNVNASSAWQPMVQTVPRMTQKIFLPVRSIRKPKTGEATAEMMYTKLKIFQSIDTGYSNSAFLIMIIFNQIDWYKNLTKHLNCHIYCSELSWQIIKTMTFYICSLLKLSVNASIFTLKVIYNLWVYDNTCIYLFTLFAKLGSNPHFISKNTLKQKLIRNIW